MSEDMRPAMDNELVEAVALEPPKGLHKTHTWEPYVHMGDGHKDEAFRRSDGAGYVIRVFDEREWKPTDLWWVTFAHPMLCGRPGWHHHAFGSYSSAEAGAMAFDTVYELCRISGYTARLTREDRAALAAMKEG